MTREEWNEKNQFRPIKDCWSCSHACIYFQSMCRLMEKEGVSDCSLTPPLQSIGCQRWELAVFVGNESEE